MVFHNSCMKVFTGTDWRGDSDLFVKDEIFPPFCTFGVEAGRVTQALSILQCGATAESFLFGRNWLFRRECSQWNVPQVRIAVLNVDGAGNSYRDLKGQSESLHWGLFLGVLVDIRLVVNMELHKCDRRCVCVCVRHVIKDGEQVKKKLSNQIQL